MSAKLGDQPDKVRSLCRHQPVSVEVLLDVQKARPALEQIANKWSVLILTVLCTRPSRFNEIMRRLDGITHKALADALKRLSVTGLFVARY
jgi:DNA-binding HxlR family transcriptional regulator